LTFWQAFRTTAREAGIGALWALPFAAAFMICVWLLSAQRYATAAVVAAASVIAWLAISARLYQRRVERDDREWRALGFGKHEEQ
jgi:membrane protein implicated in regulation of membrane protease activity